MPKILSIKKTFHLRNLILIFLAFLFTGSVGYKYFEWKTFSDLSSAYNEVYFDELKLTSENMIPSASFSGELRNNKQFNKPLNNNDYLQGLTTVENKLSIVINNEEGNGDFLKNSKEKFAGLQNNDNFLFGERGDIAKSIINKQLSYYQDELKQNNLNLAMEYGMRILFTIYRDNTALNDFSKTIGSSTDSKYIGKYFGDIASLEKYANSDFKFDKEDFIKNYYPSFVSKVDNWKKYFATYYIAEKDFAVGNTETARLELQAVQDNASSSYIDYSSLFNEQSITYSELMKDILKQVSDQAVAIKDYKSKQLYKYPFLKDVNVWKDDFVLCQMYDFKSSIYHSITSNYPVAKNVPDLIKELSTISPKTDNVDNRFDKSIMEFTNSDKRMDFTCKDKYSGEKLNFFTIKSY